MFIARWDGLLQFIQNSTPDSQELGPASESNVNKYGGVL